MNQGNIFSCWNYSGYAENWRRCSLLYQVRICFLCNLFLVSFIMKFLSRLWSAICCVPYIQKEWIAFISQKSCETSLTFVSSSESEKCKLLFFITPWSIFIWFPSNITWLPNNLLYCESLNVNLYSYNTSQKLFQVESIGRKIFQKRHHYNTFFKWKKHFKAESKKLFINVRE